MKERYLGQSPEVVENASGVGILIAKIKDIQTLSPRDQHVLRFYVQSGNLTEVRYRDEPEVRVILKKVERKP